MPRGTPINSLKFKDTAQPMKLVEKLKRASERELVKSRGTVMISHAASEALLDTIDEENINLLVMGWKGRGGEGRILGTTIDKMVQRANCNAVVFKDADLAREVKKILVVAAPDWHASYATGFAVLMAKRDEAEITIFSAGITDEEVERQKNYAKRLADICHIHDIGHELKVVKTESIENAILAESENCDLVVMGASQDWEHQAFAFGSLQDSLAKKLKKPVLMVRKIRN